MHSSLTLLDGIVFFGIFALTLATVAWGRKKLKTEHQPEDPFELLLMGRKITLPLFIASLVASWYGEISGVTAYTFKYGIYSFLTQSVVWYAAYLIFVFILIDRIPKNGASTFPELIGNHLGKKAYRVAAVLTILNMLPIAGTLSLGIFIHFLTGWSIFVSSAIGILGVFSYSMSGGLRSVVFADIVQFIAMVTAIILVAVFSMIQFGSPTKMMELLPATHLQWSGGKPVSEVFIWLFIAMSTLVDPLFYQRTLAAKNTRQAKLGVFGATCVWFIFDCAAVTGALYARAYFPDLNPNESYLQYAMQLLPAGFRGFLLAGVFSALLSSLDSHLFSAGSMIAHDLLDRERFSKRRLQFFMLVVGVGALCITPVFEDIATVWKVMGSISTSCLLFPWLLMMVFPRFKNERSFLMSIASGLVMMIVGVILEHQGLTTIDLFYFGLGGSMLGYLVALLL